MKVESWNTMKFFFRIFYVLCFFGALNSYSSDIVFRKDENKANTYYVTPGSEYNVDRIEQLFFSRNNLLRLRGGSFSVRMEDLESVDRVEMLVDTSVLTPEGKEEKINVITFLEAPASRISISGGDGSSIDDPICVTGVQSWHEMDEVIQLLVEKISPDAEEKSTNRTTVFYDIHRVVYSLDEKDHIIFIKIKEKKSILDEERERKNFNLGDVTWRPYVFCDMVEMSIPNFLSSRAMDVSENETGSLLSVQQKNYMRKKLGKTRGDNLYLTDEIFITDRSFSVDIGIYNKKEFERLFSINLQADGKDEEARIFSDWYNEALYNDPEVVAYAFQSPCVTNKINGISCAKCWYIVNKLTHKNLVCNYVFFLEGNEYIVMFFRGRITNSENVWNPYIDKIANSVRKIN